MTQIKKKWAEGARIKEKRDSQDLSAEKLALKLGVTKENIYKWERGSKPSDPDQLAALMKWLNDLENGTNKMADGTAKHEAKPDLLATLMETMTQLMKTQNSLLEEQKKEVVSKISTIETNLNRALGGVSKLSLHVESAREVVLQSLARLEKKKDENALLKEADKRVGQKIESLNEQDTSFEDGM